MKKFVFSLENVLRFKKQTLDMLKNEMAQIQMKIHQIEQKITQLKQEYDSLNKAFILEMKTGVEPFNIGVYKRYFAELDRRTKNFEAQKSALQKAAAAKQAEIVKMNKDISGLEKLRDSQKKVYEAQDRKEQELMVEEFISHRLDSMKGLTA
ncbi:MAG: Flagellar FliJ protein [Oscillospiraceae bacterium]|jgi:flagellar protein FliJ